ncbi:unnamed protein product [Ectocarpus sp. CCAP 1310/34]|nr:unnamed protein product [Ectocarpus sp. CCAP 1310/34]
MIIESCVLAVRSGACFGAANARAKALQIQLGFMNPQKSANNGFAEEFGLSFNVTPPAEEPGATKRRRHPWGSDAGPYYAPDTLHDCNHGIDCRQSYGWIDSCKQLSGVCLTVHEHNHAEKKKFLHMLNAMKFDRFAFMVVLINETENEAINRKTVAGLVQRVLGHSSDRLKVCMVEVWFCGRCFCKNPLMRSFDQVGRVILTFLR